MVEAATQEAAREFIRVVRTALSQQQAATHKFCLSSQVVVAAPGSPGDGLYYDLALQCPMYRKPLERLTRAGSHASELAIGNLLDHVRSIGLMIGDESLPCFAHVAASRVAIEAAVTSCRWLDPNISTPERLLLVAAGGRYSALQDKKAADCLPASVSYAAGAKAAAQNRYDETLRHIAETGIKEAFDRRGDPSHYVWNDGATKVPLKFNITSEVAKWFPDLPAIYQTGSGAVHSVPWQLADAVAESDTAFSGYRVRPSILGIGAAVDAVLVACSTV
ncbi:hypothetical protein [Acrocarpospora pleiomorpha]|uniref:hypothetical protein n=1 Tax=Acrocarpospora pleiomorpha TaxID=90975 RepID=UPI0012D30CB0|nr:hypothetical protein [Acrocarpospora pleiomorpha]